MDTLDDLLIRRRRGGLSDAEERRLRAGLRASPEHELALLAGDVFERDGSPLPGDAERLRSVVAGALPRTSSARRRWAWPRPRLWVAAPLFVAAAAAASVGGYRALDAWRTPEAAPRELTPPPPTPSPPARDGAETRAAAPAPEPPPSSQPTAPSAATPLVRAFESPRAAPRASARASQRTQRARALGARRVATPTPAPPSPSPVGSASAAELFQRANAARQTDWPAAAALYTELVERHPRSTEAGVAEVALGKWSLALGRGGDALEWFLAHQRRGAGPLAAEALWGEARALESIGSHAAARGAWRRLLESYPDSPYARVARERLAS